MLCRVGKHTSTGNTTCAPATYRVLGVSHRRAGEIPCLAARCKSPREGRRHPAERSDSWGVERRVGHDLQWRGGVGDGKIADARQYQARTRGDKQGDLLAGISGISRAGIPPESPERCRASAWLIWPCLSRCLSRTHRLPLLPPYLVVRQTVWYFVCMCVCL